MTHPSATSTARRAIAAVAVCAVYFLHAPLAYVGALRLHPLFPPLVLAAIAAGVWGLAKLRESAPRAAKAIAAVYFLAVGAGLVLPLYFLFLLGPWTFPIPLAAGFVAAAVFRRGDRSAALVAVVVATAVLAQAVTIGFGAAALMGVLVAFWAGALVTGRPAALSRAAIGFAVVGLLVSTRLIAFLAGVPPDAAHAVESQPETSIVVTPEELADPDASSFRRVEVRFAIETCDGEALYVGTRGARPGLFRIAKSGGDRGFLPMDGDVSDNLAADCDRGVAYVGCYGCGKAYEIDAKTLAIARTIDKPGVEVGIFRLPADGRRLYMIPDATSDVTLIDTATFAEIGTKGYPHWNSAMIVDDPAGHVVKMSNAGDVVLYDRHSMEIVAEKRVAGRLYFNVVLAERRNELLVGNMASGRFFALDRNALATTRKGRGPRGIRFMAYDERRDLLYVANFFDGTLAAVSPDDFAVRSVLRVGPRPRWVSFAEGGDALLVASGVGAVRVDLARWVGAPASERSPL